MKNETFKCVMPNLNFSMIRLTTALTTWTLINKLLGKNNKPNNLSELSVNDNLVSDPKSMAEALNDYFVNVGPTLAAEYQEESCNIAQTTNDNTNSFLLRAVLILTNSGR